MHGCLVMFVKNVFRSFRSTHIQGLCGGGREEGNFPWVIFTFSKKDSSLIFKEAIKYIFSSRGTNTKPSSLHTFAHMLPLNSPCPPPTCPFHFLLPPHPPVRCICPASTGSCPRRRIPVDPCGAVSIGTCKEPGSLCFPAHVFVVWPDPLMEFHCC